MIFLYRYDLTRLNLRKGIDVTSKIIEIIGATERDYAAAAAVAACVDCRQFRAPDKSHGYILLNGIKPAY